MNQIKFSVFADLHFRDTFTGDAEERLDLILERAKKEQVDFVIHLGDLCHDPHACKSMIDRYNNFEIPTYHVMGNHDTDGMALEEVIKCYQMPAEYYFFDRNGFRFIVLNTNYYRYEGKDFACSLRNYYDYFPYLGYLSQEQLVWLEEVVMTSPYPMVLLSHESLSLYDHNGTQGMKNREDVQDIFRKARANHKQILLCLNGHYHMDFMHVADHTCYLDINSATMYWMGMQGEHYLYPEEFHKAHKESNQLLVYNDPIHAVITLSEDGCIDICGMESSFYCDVTKETAMGDRNTPVKVLPRVLTDRICLPLKG